GSTSTSSSSRPWPENTAYIKTVEESLKPSAERLKATVAQKVEKLGDRSPTTRKNYLDIFSATVPDPVDLGLATEA
ncbi:MAG: type IV secretory system conjugative DNA transfer family protein, partial [Mesorhizobium sp.]